MKKHKLYIYPTTVEGMATIFKTLCSLYLSGEITIIQFTVDLLDLKDKFNGLFISALTVRWIGKKRLELIKPLVGELQRSLF